MVRKYNNKPTVVDGIRFPSMKQAKRYSELKLLEKAGRIADLDLEFNFRIEVKGQKICTYRADFVYDELEKSGGVITCSRVVEDTKGFRTAVYRLKKKLMKAVHGIEIRET